MIIQHDAVVDKSKDKKSKIKKEKSPKKSAEPVAKKKATVGVPTNRRDKLVDIGYMKPHNFLSSTEATMTQIYPMTHLEGNRFEVANEPSSVSTILKMVMNVTQTNELSEAWSLILWNITQRPDLLPDGVSVTFTRSFERKDNELTRKSIVKRRRLATLSSDSQENVKRQSVAVAHDMGLVHAIDTGDSVVSFGAEAIITAPDDKTLEQAVTAIQNYLSSNDETRGLRYELDINKQSRPFIVFGPNDAVGNGDVSFDMTSYDAGVSALLVDSGGDRRLGSEYVGVSIGKLIRSHAAYSFRNTRSLFVGNDAEKKTHTMGRTIHEPSQIYLSKVASRAYLLDGKSVVHFVIDEKSSVDHLMRMPLGVNSKVAVDASKGLLNILEVIDDGRIANDPELVLGLFPTHINNIIALLSQFRSVDISTTDEFATITREILIDFFVKKGYWDYNARENLESIRLVGVEHTHVKTLADLGQFVSQRKRSNRDQRLESALFELDSIINGNILPTIPSLNTTTSELIDDVVRAPYRVVDLTGMSVGAMRNVTNPSMNVMAISYLNLMLPTLNNGDVIFMHGVSVLSPIAGLIKSMIESSGVNVDVVYTEKNQIAALEMLGMNDSSIDLVMVDLYNNRVERLVEPLSIDDEWASALSQNPASFFVKSGRSLDYILLDAIL